MTPQQINLYCQKCEEERAFIYTGEQEGFENNLLLYNCEKCNTTRGLRADILKVFEEDLK